ncbi:MAG: hypothetical protein QGI78_07435 [Phycisphaerales bacterium]|jgi:hypothetical protein|nr:hypothetical protein [Phycisphaerales bacterium]
MVRSALTNTSNNRHESGWATVPAILMLGVISAITAGIASVSWTNVQSANAMIAIARAQSAAESGLAFAARRLQSESSRYVIDQGVIGSDLADKLWHGTWTGADGIITILPPEDYTITSSTGLGIVHALFDVFDEVDLHCVERVSGDALLPALTNGDSHLELKPIALDANSNGAIFRLSYELLSGSSTIEITSTGESDGISRSISMQFELDKRIDYAIIAMSRLMLGKNVLVEGPIGTRFGTDAGELNSGFGVPLVMESDFRALDPAILGVELDSLASLILANDVDGDCRLRTNHALESAGLGGTLVDYDGDEYVTDFDLFLSHYDSDGDIAVVFDPVQADAAGFPGLWQEFSDDVQLALLIDNARADRNGDGIVNTVDQELGWNDGIIDSKDRYGKIDGSIAFGVSVEDWESATALDWQTDLQGSVVSALGEAPSSFNVPEEQLTELSTGMFNGATTWFETKSMTGVTFGDSTSGQVQSNLQNGGSYFPSEQNSWEGIPYEAEGAYDWYQRAIYKDMTFNNVRIPVGTNALFENCMFVGVTWVETNEQVDDPNWNYAGAVAPDGVGGYQVRFEELEATSDGNVYQDTRVVSNNVRFHDCTFLGSIAGDVPSEYTHWRNKVQVTGESRFFIDPNDPNVANQPDAALLQSTLLAMDPSDLEQMARSSILMPGWSVEIGAFTNNEAVGVNLQGTIVTGLLDLRGVVDVHGAILSTYRPVEGVGPLFYGGDADAFNSTIGYFGPEDGDGEGVDDAMKPFEGYGRISLRANPDATLPDGVPWPITVVADSSSYQEGYE